MSKVYQRIGQAYVRLMAEDLRAIEKGQADLAKRIQDHLAQVLPDDIARDPDKVLWYLSQLTEVVAAWRDLDYMRADFARRLHQINKKVDELPKASAPGTEEASK